MTHKKVVAIHQPNFFPWIPYFRKIAYSDAFIFLDDVQFPRGNRGCFINRTRVCVGGREKWLTLPIQKAQSLCNVNEIGVSLDSLEQTMKSALNWYRGAPYFKEVSGILISLTLSGVKNLAAVNMEILRRLCTVLDIPVQFFKASDLSSVGASTDRLISLVQAVDGSCYFSGSTGKDYQDEKSFAQNNIEIVYNDYHVVEYEQFNAEAFIPNLSILDALMNCGIERTSDMIRGEP